MHDVLVQAIEMHQTGQFGPAARRYQTVLAREQENIDALHLLGVLNHQQGDHLRAVELISRAIALRPSFPVFHVNLAEAYRALGQLERAAGCCRVALGLRPDFPEAHGNLGLALRGLGRNAEAVEHFRRAVDLQPESASAHSNLGIALRDLGQLENALTHFRRAVAHDRTSATAQTNLGQILIDIDKADEALPHCQKAVRLQPDVAAYQHNLGHALRLVGRLGEARAAYLEAIRLDSRLAKSYAHLGLVLQEDGQFSDAMTWLTQAVELNPDDATFWEYLAELHAEREDPAKAIPCWDRVLALEPQRASAHNRLGWALREEGRLSDAREHYHTALQLKPDFAPAHLSLGGLHEELGELAEAEADFREALRVQPGLPLAYGRLATLLRGKLPDADRAALEKRLANPKLGDGPRARLLFALAHVLDAHGEFGRAADCLREANALSLERPRRQKRDYVPAEHERFVDSLTEAFNAGVFERLAGTGLETRRPVFVFGMPRSGTTLVEQILASHSQVHGAGELRLARKSLDSVPTMVGRSDRPLDCIADLDPETVQRLARQHETELLQIAGRPAERVVDKMPENFNQLGLLAVLFPRATFIHCRRDLRDVAVSCWMTDFASIRWANDQNHIATRIQQYCRVMEHWRKVLPVTIHEVHYEETVADLECVARRLIDWCGLSWEPACLRFHETRRPVRTASVSQVRQPIYQQSVARWKNYETALASLFASIPAESVGQSMNQ